MSEDGRYQFQPRPIRVGVQTPSAVPQNIQRLVADALAKELRSMDVPKVVQDRDTGVQDIVPAGTWLATIAKNNWKFISGVVLAAAAYFTEIRDTVNSTAKATQENAEAVKDIADAIKKTSEDTHQFKKEAEARAEKLEQAVTKTLVTTVKSTEHLERMIEAANPRAEKVKEPPELRAAKDEVQSIEARKALFEDK